MTKITKINGIPIYADLTGCLRDDANAHIVGDSGNTPLTIQSKDSVTSYMGFKTSSGTLIGSIGVSSASGYNGRPTWLFDGDTTGIALLSDIPGDMVTESRSNTFTNTNQFNSDVTLYSPSGSSPALIFQRGTLTDNYNDWQLIDVGGHLYFRQRGQNSNEWSAIFTLQNTGVGILSSSLVVPTVYFDDANKYSVAKASGATRVDVTVNNTSILQIGTDDTKIVTNFSPTSDGSKTLGDSTNAWGNIFTKGQVKKGSYTYTWPSASGTIALEKPDQIFFCTYGSTDGEDIAAAITAGKYVAVIYNGNIYGNVMYHSGESKYYFSGFYGSYTRLFVRCSATGHVWENGSAAFQGTSAKIQTITNASTADQYPSGAAVYNFVQAEKPKIYRYI